jgi:hypothetical protein
MSKQKELERIRTKKKQERSRQLVIGGILLLLILGTIAVSRALHPSKPNANSLDVAGNLPNTDSAFNVGTRVGQVAPVFTLLDANRQSYKFQVGDGRKYVFAFNMGYV